MSAQYRQQADDVLTSYQREAEQARRKSEQTHLKSLLLDHYHCTFFLPIVGDSEKTFSAEPRPMHRLTTFSRPLFVALCLIREGQTVRV